jgi:hypothetical protein
MGTLVEMTWMWMMVLPTQSECGGVKSPVWRPRRSSGRLSWRYEEEPLYIIQQYSRVHRQ